MAELKTKRNDASVAVFLAAILDDQRREDCRSILATMRRATRTEPKMWGASIVGFGSYHYRYASGREGDWFLTGFSPRKRDITLYVMSGFARHAALMRRLGKYKIGKSCLYVKTLADVDLEVLAQLIRESAKQMRLGRT